MKQKITIIVIIIVAFFISLSLIKQISIALNQAKRLETSAEEVTALQKANKELRTKLAQTHQYESIEQIARNKLNLSKPNETIVVIPPHLIEQTLNTNKKIEPPKTPNWQGWLDLFI